MKASTLAMIALATVGATQCKPVAGWAQETPASPAVTSTWKMVNGGPSRTFVAPEGFVWGSGTIVTTDAYVGREANEQAYEIAIGTCNGLPYFATADLATAPSATQTLTIGPCDGVVVIEHGTDYTTPDSLTVTVTLHPEAIVIPTTTTTIPAGPEPTPTTTTTIVEPVLPVEPPTTITVPVVTTTTMAYDPCLDDECVQLPATGSEPLGTATFGLVMLALGVGFVFLPKRRGR